MNNPAKKRRTDVARKRQASPSRDLANRSDNVLAEQTRRSKRSAAERPAAKPAAKVGERSATVQRKRVNRRPLLFDDGEPSNFYVGAPIYVINPITLSLEQFPTNEHYFQAYKEYHALHGTKKGFYQIAGAAYPDGRPNPGLAKRLGRQVNFTNADLLRWDLFVAPEVMLRVNLAKFIQNKHCQEWLRATGNRTLVEHRKDPVWGDNLDGTGKNMLGKILMLVRTHITEV